MSMRVLKEGVAVSGQRGGSELFVHALTPSVSIIQSLADATCLGLTSHWGQNHRFHHHVVRVAKPVGCMYIDTASSAKL